jgi:hypothetical protein
VILLISAFSVARITGMSHWRLAETFYLGVLNIRILDPGRMTVWAYMSPITEEGVERRGFKFCQLV